LKSGLYIVAVPSLGSYNVELPASPCTTCAGVCGGSAARSAEIRKILIVDHLSHLCAIEILGDSRGKRLDVRLAAAFDARHAISRQLSDELVQRLPMAGRRDNVLGLAAPQDAAYVRSLLFG
jgi:hypothetical protein